MKNQRRLVYADEVEDLINGLDSLPWEEDVQMLVNSLSTVDAVEVVHGRWIAVPSSDMMTGKAYKCSECNKMRYGSFMPNYCQNCGAKMDGERKGND